jgi:hypothetical protein
VRKLQALGLSADDALDTVRPLSARAEQAARCWRFCDGWVPERWPVFDALEGVHDWPALAELMQAIRDAVESRS